MKVVLDSSIIIDYLNGRVPQATELVNELFEDADQLWSSHVVRTEVLAGMRRGEERRTEGLLQLIEWASVGRSESDAAGALGREHARATPGIDTPDLLVAELALRLGARLLTTNVKHFPMFPGLKAPYSYR